MRDGTLRLTMPDGSRYRADPKEGGRIIVSWHASGVGQDQAWTSVGASFPWPEDGLRIAVCARVAKHYKGGPLQDGWCDTAIELARDERW